MDEVILFYSGRAGEGIISKIYVCLWCRLIRDSQTVCKGKMIRW